MRAGRGSPTGQFSSSMVCAARMAIRVDFSEC